MNVVARGARTGLLAAGLLMSCLVGAPSARAATGGPDAAGYTWYDINSGCFVQSDVFQTVNSGSFVLGGATELIIGPLDLGFTFPFYNTTTTQIWLHQSGLIFFQTPPNGTFTVNQVIPRTRDGVSGFLAPYWAWNRYTNPPHAWWQSFASEGYFKVSLALTPVDASSAPVGTVNMEVYLYKNGDIRIEYLSPGDGTAATIGMESPDESTGLQMRYNSTMTNGMTYGNPTPFSICIDKKRYLNCSSTTPITCGTPVNGTSPGSVVSNATDYGCGTGVWSGKEKVYRLDLTALSDLTVSLTNIGTRVMAAWLLADCDEWDCVAGGSTSFSAPAVTPGTYYLVVDAAQTRDEGAFTLQVNCAAVSEPIGCEESLAGTTVGAPDHVSAWACLPGDFSGPDRVYEVNFTPPGNLTATLTPATGQTVFIMDGTRPLVGTNCLISGTNGAVLYDPAPGPYFIVVDQPPGAARAYTLSLTCAPLIACTPGEGSLSCQQRVSSTTVGLPSFVDFYRCSPQLYSGPEAVYTFTNPTQQVVSFVLDSADPGLDIMILDSCNEAACTTIGDTEASADLAPGTYHVVVDGRDGAAGPFTLSTICGFGLEPATLSLNGAEGECFSETKTAWLTPELVRADVLLTLDLTGSMGGELTQVQDNLQSIIDSLQAFIPDVQIGLASYMDYPASGNYTQAGCTYNNVYGNSPDYPWRLEMPITSDRAALQAAVDALVIGGGGDGPESYNRMMFEAVNDPGIGWRPGSRRIVVDFGDEMPHDCNVLACLGDVAPSSRGLDLGRDGTNNTADDLATDQVVQGLVDARTVLIHFDSSGGGLVGPYTYEEIWNCWAQRTGGRAIAINSNGTVPPDVGGIDCDPTLRPDCLAELISVLIQEQGSWCSELQLVAEPGFEAWLVDPGPVYNDVRLPASVTFNIQFCVPPGTPAGPYDFTVELLCGGQVVTTQSVHVDVVVDCAPSVVSTPRDATICEGESTTLDASGMSLVNCPGTTVYEWTDSLGAVVGSGPTLLVTPSASETYTVKVTCSAVPTCGTSASAFVDVHLPPLFSGLSVTDPASCNLGLELTWPAATFRDPSATGTYNVYRSEISCDDAVTRPPIARGLSALRWVDTTTRDGRSYYYVVQAEDARAGTVCPQGPNNGGAVNAAPVCFGPVLEAADPTLPAGLGWWLRASHAGDTVTFTWDGTRPLLGGEHFHVLKGYDSVQPYPRVNPEGQLTTTWVDLDTTRRLQFFDIRIANACEAESEDDEPPFLGR